MADTINIMVLYWGRKGGGAHYSLELARELNLQKGVNLTLSISNQCELREQFRKIGAPIHYVDTNPNIPAYAFNLTFGRPKIKKGLIRFLQNRGVDLVIIGMDFFWGETIYKACREEGVKSLLVVHEATPHPREPFYMVLMKKAGLSKSITGADHLVTLTDHVKRIVTDRYPVADSDISVIPHGIFSYYNASSPRKLPEKGPTRIIYFGRIEYYKGLDLLVDAYSKLEKMHSNLILEIWGSGSLAEVKEKLTELQNVKIENRWVGEEEIPKIFQQAHICVLPYRDASQSGIVGIASDAGVPIVATPAAGLVEQLEKAGAVIARDIDADALCDAMNELLQNPGLYSNLSEESIRYAESLQWDSIAEEFHRLGLKLTE